MKNLWEVILKSNWLPSPRIIRTSIEKILKAFEDVVQIELMKVRWEEIKRLKVGLALA